MTTAPAATNRHSRRRAAQRYYKLISHYFAGAVLMLAVLIAERQRIAHADSHAGTAST
jgi:hypothetical protein